MKKLFTLSILSFCLVFVGMAQDQDVKAKPILDKLSKEMKSYKSIGVDFKMTIKGSRSESTTGTAGISGEKFFFHTKQEKTWNNGVNHWSLEDGDDVCYQSDVDEEEDALNPKEILTIWENDFKYKYIEGTDTHHIIKLYPNDPKKSKYHTVTMKVKKSGNKLSSISIKTKDGMTIALTVVKLTPNKEFKSSDFMFSKAKNPGIEIEEL